MASSPPTRSPATRAPLDSSIQLGVTTRLVVLHTPDASINGRVVVLEDNPVRIGRMGHLVGPLALDDPQLSREHAVVQPGPDDTWTLADLGSSNGTFLEGARIQRAALQTGNVLRVGTTLLLFERLELESDTLLEPQVAGLLGPSVAMQRVRGELGLVAPRRIPLLLLGSSGTGKERVAAELHRRSGRSGPLVAVNCAAIPDNLLESEMFGHVEGAFSGATRARVGLFQQADGGTIFLDELGEMPIQLQPKLLRVLADGEVRRVGSTRSQRVDVRVVAATNVDIHASIRQGRFRGDLYARLAGWVLTIPDLAARRQDILPLARHFLRREEGGLSLSASAAEALLLYRWPYNVRELEQAMTVAATRAASSGQVRPQHLPSDVRGALATRGAQKSRKAASSPLALQVSRQATPSAEDLRRVLRHYDGNLARTAAFFGKDRRQVYRWIRRLGLDPKEFRQG